LAEASEEGLGPRRAVEPMMMMMTFEYYSSIIGLEIKIIMTAVYFPAKKNFT
jgi:hypothetical protein